MITDFQTAVAFTNLSPVRQSRLSTLLSGAERAWRVQDNRSDSGRHNWCATYVARDLEKASARLLRLGRR